ncbi:helix-turn-helix domain-containing protein [Erwinia piriflorinigrans]|uniref:helix-turn-helix domain-containing protein n=1 Tax=Erwinia piriflorinigrans TaxID=665097 RepID=UPI00066057A4|nr:helix-turn-helix transcriptional regulator [Erwinia piriflorinigrans]
MSAKEILKKNRILLGLSQQDLAVKLGKPQSYISKIEQGERRVDITEFIELCVAMEVSPVDLFEEILKDFKK